MRPGMIHQAIACTHSTPCRPNARFLHVKSVVTRALKQTNSVLPACIIRAVLLATFFPEAVQNTRPPEFQQFEHSDWIHRIICCVEPSAADKCCFDSVFAFHGKQCIQYTASAEITHRKECGPTIGIQVDTSRAFQSQQFADHRDTAPTTSCVESFVATQMHINRVFAARTQKSANSFNIPPSTCFDKEFCCLLLPRLCDLGHFLHRRATKFKLSNSQRKVQTADNLNHLQRNVQRNNRFNI